MPPLKIAAILPLYPPGSRVGAWLATHGLLRGLADRGHQVRVVTFLRHQQQPYRLDGIEVMSGSEAQRQSTQADVVIAHLGSKGPDALQAIRFAAPVVRIVHGLPADHARLQGCQLLVANSASTLAAFDGWEGRKILCHPPTNPAEFRAQPALDRRISAVNLSAEKGGDLFWAIAAAMPEERFLAVRGGYGTQIEQQLPNVELAGPNLANMAGLVYARTKLLLLPSRAETWGMVAVEAACSGIPTLARPLPGLRESLGRAGNWQEGDDPAEWAEAIRALLGTRRYAGASQRARRRIRELDFQAERDRFADSIEELCR